MRRYIWNLLIAIDQLLNALRGGDPDETISSVCAKRIASGTKSRSWKALAWFLELVDPGHLSRAVEWDEGMDAVREYRQTLASSATGGKGT